MRPRDGVVVGQDVSEQTLRDVSQAFGNRIEPAVVLTIEHLVTEDGKSYVKVTFSGDGRPYACDGRYRVRSADEDLPMGAAMLEQMMLERAARKSPWDRRPSGRPLSDVDEGALRRFVEEGNACGRIEAPYSNAGEVLGRLSLVSADGTLTNAAAVLFCPSRAGARLKAGILADHSRVDILDLQQYDGPAYELIRRAEAYVLSNIRRRLVIDGSIEREEVPEIPREAFREAIVNAFCHRDWSDCGTAVQIDIYPDAVDITNPGTFPKSCTPEMYLSGEEVTPHSRNPLIASTLFRSKAIESFGSGIRRIRGACDRAGVHFEYLQGRDATTVRFHRNDPFGAQGAESEEAHAGSGKVPAKFRERARRAVGARARSMALPRGGRHLEDGGHSRSPGHQRPSDEKGPRQAHRKRAGRARRAVSGAQIPPDWLSQREVRTALAVTIVLRPYRLRRANSKSRTFAGQNGRRPGKCRQQMSGNDERHREGRVATPPPPAESSRVVLQPAASAPLRARLGAAPSGAPKALSTAVPAVPAVYWSARAVVECGICSQPKGLPLSEGVNPIRAACPRARPLRSRETRRRPSREASGRRCGRPSSKRGSCARAARAPCRGPPPRPSSRRGSRRR